MRRYTTHALAGFAATLAMAAAVAGPASARVFSLSNPSFRAIWTLLDFDNNVGFGRVECPVTLEGSFHSQILNKVEKALIGHISRATVSEIRCLGGTATVHQESLPWHITYNGFRGILPRINSIRILLSGPRFQIRSPLIARTCTATADTEHEARGEALLNASQEVVNIVPDEGPNIPTNGTCELASVRLRGTATDGMVTLLGTITTRIRITLI